VLFSIFVFYLLISTGSFIIRSKRYVVPNRPNAGGRFGTRTPNRFGSVRPNPNRTPSFLGARPQGWRLDKLENKSWLNWMEMVFTIPA